MIVEDLQQLLPHLRGQVLVVSIRSLVADILVFYIVIIPVLPVSESCFGFNGPTEWPGWLS